MIKIYSVGDLLHDPRPDTIAFPMGLIEIPFEAFIFPGGEPHCKIDPELIRDKNILVDARINSMDELGKLLVIMDAMDELPNSKYLLIPYFPGARQDRVTSEGSPFTLAVTSFLINSCGFRGIFVLDPHSGVTQQTLDNCITLPAGLLMLYAREHNFPGRLQGIIAPDEGAIDRATFVAENFHLPLYRAQKHRDPSTGKLSKFSCEPLRTDGNYLVIDDICDGGGTFIGLAEAIGLTTKISLHLFTTHGIYSKGTDDLREYFNSIICTDSWLPPDPTRLAFGRRGVQTIEILPLYQDLILDIILGNNG